MNTSLKIVFYTKGLPFNDQSIEQGALGGAESALIYLARELAELGHEINVYCNCPKPGIYNQVNYLDVSNFQNWCTKNEVCDLFICSRFFQIFHHPIPARLKTLWLHDHLNQALANELKPILPSIDIVYCVSQYHLKYISQFFQESLYKFSILSNGIDLAMTEEILQTPIQKQHKIMFTSRPERGLEEALLIYKELGDKNLEFLACSYPYPNEQVEQPYVALINHLKAAGYPIRFEQFNKASLYKNIAESKAVIYPANTPEIFCISAVEAQACRTVFLGRALGALNETVGYPCLKEFNPQLFYQATKQVLNSPYFRKTLEQLGWQHVQQFSWSNSASKLSSTIITRLNHTKQSASNINTAPANEQPSILILTPIKNAMPSMAPYFSRLQSLDYPKEKISLGFLESDSDDGTYDSWKAQLGTIQHNYQEVKIWKRDYKFIIPPGLSRHTTSIQIQRRSILAKSRNYLLSKALQNQEWVLWLDADVVEYPVDIIQRLLALDKDIVHPHCVKQYGGKSFDCNAWQKIGDKAVRMEDMRWGSPLVPLDAVGGTMLLVKADIHREGLIFPPFPYGLEHPKIRHDNFWKGELETEGLGIMAQDMGYQPWGVPGLEIKHADH